ADATLETQRRPLHLSARVARRCAVRLRVLSHCVADAAERRCKMTLSPHVASLISPLSAATSRLLRELPDLNDCDRLEVRCAVNVIAEEELSIRQFLCQPKHDDWYALSQSIRGGWWRRIPDARPHSMAQFSCPASDTSALILLAAL